MQLAFASAVLVLLVVGAISYRAMAVSTESERWVRHTHEVLDSLQNLLLATERIKSSYVGFTLTGKDAYLESYHAGRSSVEKELGDIVKSYQLQANCYLSKPVQLNEFELLVKSINDFWLTKVMLPQQDVIRKT